MKMERRQASTRIFTIPRRTRLARPGQMFIRVSITRAVFCSRMQRSFSLGSNPTRGVYEEHMEIYSPAYLFTSSGSLATRPTITSVTPGVIGYGATFQVQTPQASTISSAVLMRPGAVTHAFDMDQRLINLSYTVGSGVLTVTAPPNGNVAPPGYYMLFILNSSGVPSLATFVQLSAKPTDTPPTGSITSPSSNPTIGTWTDNRFRGIGHGSRRLDRRLLVGFPRWQSRFEHSRESRRGHVLDSREPTSPRSP